jgi:hypothetical protein
MGMRDNYIRGIVNEPGSKGLASSRNGDHVMSTENGRGPNDDTARELA